MVAVGQITRISSCDSLWATSNSHSLTVVKKPEYKVFPSHFFALSCPLFNVTEFKTVQRITHLNFKTFGSCKIDTFIMRRHSAVPIWSRIRSLKWIQHRLWFSKLVRTYCWMLMILFERLVVGAHEESSTENAVNFTQQSWATFFASDHLLL